MLDSILMFLIRLPNKFLLIILFCILLVMAWFRGITVESLTDMLGKLLIGIIALLGAQKYGEEKSRGSFILNRWGTNSKTMPDEKDKDK